MSKKRSMILVSIVCLLGLVIIYGCASVVETATTASTSTTSTTSTSGTTTSTTTSTTTTILQVSGTITDYSGTEDELWVFAWKDMLHSTIGVSSTFSVLEGQAVYLLTPEVSGMYFLAAFDYDPSGTPAAHNWMGGYGWEGTVSIEAAGDIVTASRTLSQNIISLEVSSAVTADFTMHEIISGEGATLTFGVSLPAAASEITGVGATLWNVASIEVAEDLFVRGSEYKGAYVEGAAGETVNLQFFYVPVGAYYCRFDATGATYTGAYGWSGTAEVTDEDVISTVWTNIESFEVTDSDQDLGNNTLHFVVQ